MFKRAKGRQAAYDKLNGHDTAQASVNRKPRLSIIPSGDQADLVYHAKGLQRPRIAYARRIAKARNDDFYDGIRVAKGV